MSKNINFKKLRLIAFFLVVILSLFVRFYNYQNRINFSSEQGLALGVSADYIRSHFSFLGQRTFLRTTSNGHILFSGALYNYSLVPLLLIFKYQPLPITICFSLLNILTGLIVFWLVRKMSNYKVAFLSLILFMFNNVMINHSMFIWILNYLPLIGMLSIYLIWNFKFKGRTLNIILLGILSGIGFNLVYFYLFTIFLLGLFVFAFAKNKLKSLIVYSTGLFIGNWTMVLFDLRHDFYYVRTLWQYFLDTIQNPSQSHITTYHFLQFWPLFIIIFAILIERIFIWNKYLALLILGLYLIFNLSSSRISFTKAVGMSQGLNFRKVYIAAQAIANDDSSNFNLVNLPDSDFRAYALRYLVRYVFNKNPANMENYQNIDYLYVLGNSDFSLYDLHPWEIAVFKANQSETLIRLDDTYRVFRLSKH